MIFLTVGTQFPFDRLVRAVDEVVTQTGFDERIFAQVGATSYRPRNFEAVPVLEKTLFDSYLLRANGIISHAGMGTIAVALEHKKPLLVMPRLKKYGEVVNDHQLSMALQFSKLGYFLVARDVEELPKKMDALESFVPNQREIQVNVMVEKISEFLKELCVEDG